MSMSDPVSDMLTRIRNAQMVKKLSVELPSSQKKIAIVEVLKKEGYIQSYKISQEELSVKQTLSIELKYYQGRPVIEEIKRISKPGLRVYCTHKKVPSVLEGLGLVVISTSLGVMSGREARTRKIGGEVICSVI